MAGPIITDLAQSFRELCRLAKLDARNRVEIAAWAWQFGLADPAVGP